MHIFYGLNIGTEFALRIIQEFRTFFERPRKCDFISHVFLCSICSIYQLNSNFINFDGFMVPTFPQTFQCCCSRKFQHPIPFWNGICEKSSKLQKHFLQSIIIKIDDCVTIHEEKKLNGPRAIPAEAFVAQLPVPHPGAGALAGAQSLRGTHGVGFRIG